ncbi:class I SAM-dependent methyltransferase [Clostridium sp. JNZ J1-5]
MDEEKQKLISIWDKVAPTFSKVGPNYWNEFGKRLVQLSKINEGAKVLDVGMGRGASLFSAVNKIGKKGYAVGIDISEAMVKETYKDILEQHIDNIEVIKMDAAKLSFYDSSFDNVICGFGIGYILFNDRKLTEILRVLKKGGQAGFSAWGIQEDQKWLNEITNRYLNINPSSQDKNRKSDIPKFNTVEDIRKILEDSGFKNVKVYQEDADVIYMSKEEWWEEMWSNAVRGIFGQIEALGINKFKEFKEDVFDGLEKFKSIDEIHFSMPVIYGFGEK